MADIFSALATRQNPNQVYFKKLLDEGMNTSPIGSHWQGASRLAHSLLAGYMLGQQNQDEEASRKLRMDLPGLEPSPTAAAPATSPIVGALAGRGIESGPDMSLPRGLRNNNPLNIEAGPFTQGQEGFVGSDGRFARFEKPEQGINAANKLLDVYQNKHGLNTVRGIIGRWAPAGENDTRGYVNSVAARLGIDPDQPLGPEHRQALIAAMGQFENGRPIQMASGPQVVGQEGIPERPNAQGVFGPDAVMLPQQTAQVDPAALPPNATPTQGYAIPGAGQGAAIPPRSPVQIDPAMAQRIRAMIGSRDPALQQQGYELYKQFAKPREETRPLTDPRERARYGIQPTDTNPYQVDAKGEVKPINPQPFAVNVNQQGQSEFEKGYGAGISKQALEVVDRGNNAAVQQQRIALAQKMMQDLQTGKLTPLQSTVGGYLQAFGVDPKVFGIDPKTPMTAEALTALTSELVVGKIGSGGFPANNFSNPDREFLVQGVFSLADRPEANAIKLEVARRVAALDQEKADAWAEARAGGTSFEKFERDWRQKLGKQSIFGDLIDQVKAASKSPGVAPTTAPAGGTVIDGYTIRKR